MEGPSKRAHSFTSLLEQSRQLARQTGDYLIQRNVDQISHATLNLHTTLSHSTKDVDKNKGRYLLATMGFDADKLSRNLNAINLKLTYEPPQLALAGTHLEGSLNLEHDQIIEEAIRGSQKETLDHIRRSLVSKQAGDWQAAKSELLEALGFSSALAEGGVRGPSQPSMDFTAAALASPATPLSSRAGAARTAQETVALGKMAIYGKVAEELNRQRRERRAFSLMQAFQQAVQAVDDTELRRKEVADCWDLLSRVVGEPEPGSNVVALPEAVYERTYRQDPDALARKFLSGAKQFLEKQYERVMKLLVSRNPRAAELGGEPGMTSLVRGYARAVARHGQAEENGGVWAEIYYALRAGEPNAAISLAASASPPLLDLKGLLQAFTQNGHLSELQQAECRRALNAARDPFKQVVYMLLTRHTPRSLPAPISTTQDWIWFHLSLIVQEENSEAFATSLRRLQQQVCKFGPDHFNANKQPLLYFQLVLITLQFEKAVEFLWGKGDFAVEAVHFAVGLYYYGVLRVPDADAPRSPNSIYSETSEGRAAVDLPRMLWHYALAVVEQRRDLALALGYVHIVRDVALEDVMLRDFILNTREVDALLGTEGREGLVQRVLGDAARVRRLREVVAAACEERAELPAAVKLYHEAGDYEKVLSLINGALGPLVSAAGPDRQALIALALDVNTRYSSLRGVPAKPLETLRMLLQIAHFFDLSNANRLSEALQRLEMVGILPFDQALVPEKVELFSKLDETVKRGLGDLILAAMSVLYKLYVAISPAANQSSFLFPSDPARLHEMEAIKNRARALAAFTGRIQYRLPSDVTSRLLRFEVLMS